METVLVIYLVCIMIGAVGYVIRIWCWNWKVYRYLEEAHADRYINLVDRGLLKWPWQQGSVYYFWSKSSEDWGDPKIPEFRRQARRLLRGWILIVTIGFVGFGALALSASLFR